MTAALSSKAQWWDFFAAGGRHDIPLSIRAMQDQNNEWKLAGLALSATYDTLGGVMTSAGVTMITNQMNAAADKNFLGDGPAPTIGFSKHGLHLPTIPLARWEDVAAVIFGNLRSAYYRAANRDLIADPGVGSAKDAPVECLLLLRNTEKIRPTMDPRFSDGLTRESTSSGQAWGTVVPRIDPGLGPEQLMELVFLLDVLGTPHGLQIHHTGGFFAGIRSLEVEKGIHRAN